MERSGFPEWNRIQPTVRTPGPMTEDGIEKTADPDAVPKVAPETGAAQHGAGSNRGAGISEGELEEEIRQRRNPGGFIGCRQVLHEVPGVTVAVAVADEAVAVAEHPGETEGVKQDTAKAG